MLLEGHSSLHILEVLIFLDGGFQLRGGLGNHFPLKSSGFADAQLLQAPNPHLKKWVYSFSWTKKKKNTRQKFFLLVHGVHQGEDKTGYNLSHKLGNRTCSSLGLHNFCPRLLDPSCKPWPAGCGKSKPWGTVRDHNHRDDNLPSMATMLTQQFQNLLALTQLYLFSWYQGLS